MAKLTYRECLETIDAFGVKVAQSIIGGKPLHHSHHAGDLHDRQLNLFWEVKASGLSNGPIIEESQLERYHEDIYQCDRYYVFVCYTNRGPWRGKIRNLPVRIGKAHGQAGLEKFLTENTREVYILPVSVIKAIYDYARKKGQVQTYEMKTSPKTYMRTRYPHLRLLTGTTFLSGFKKFKLDPNGYEVATSENAIAKFGRFKIPIKLARITTKPITIVEDDSFDVNQLE